MARATRQHPEFNNRSLPSPSQRGPKTLKVDRTQGIIYRHQDSGANAGHATPN